MTGSPRPSTDDSSTMVVPQGRFRLERRHPVGNRPLRAWDAADVLLLEQVDRWSSLGRLGPSGTAVILDDAHGALTVALASAMGVGWRLVHRVDSFVARRAAQANLRRNGLDSAAVEWTSAVDEPPPRIDLLVARLARDTAGVAEQLGLLRPALHEGSAVVVGSMVKHLHRAALEVLGERVGQVSPSRAAHKARLLDVTVDPSTAGSEPVPVSRWSAVFRSSGQPVSVDAVGRAGVFSADRLDPAAALLVDSWLARPTSSARSQSVVDMGCGTGVVGAAVAAADAGARVVAVDDSWRAIESTRATFAATLPAADGQRAMAFVADAADELDAGDDVDSVAAVTFDGAVGLPSRSVDTVLVNPPFHDGNAVTDLIALRMFRSARRVLRPGGQIWVVGNRHLGYHVSLGRSFGRPTVVASDPRFVVLRAEVR